MRVLVPVLVLLWGLAGVARAQTTTTTEEPTTTTTTTLAPTCGDGNVDPGEDCDDGINNGDTSLSCCGGDCTFVVAGTACSFGGGTECDGADNCVTTSTTTTTTSTTTTTAPPACGDGNVDPGEDCDQGGANGDTSQTCCASDCTFQPHGTPCTFDGGAECSGEGEGCAPLSTTTTTTTLETTTTTLQNGSTNAQAYIGNARGGLEAQGGIEVLAQAAMGTARTPADTDEHVLQSYSLPADALSAGVRNVVRVKFVCNFESNTHSKEVRLKWGGTTVLDYALQQDGSGPDLSNGALIFGSADIYGTAGDQYTYGKVELYLGAVGIPGLPNAIGSLANIIPIVVGPTHEDSTQPIPIVLTGQNGTGSAGDIVCGPVVVEFLNSSPFGS